MIAQGQKKAWKKPQLTVLVRVDLAESVLGGCKLLTTSGADSVDGKCLSNWLFVCTTDCQVRRAT